MVNDTNDFDVRKRLKNLEALRAVGFAANRRLLRVQQVGRDCAIGAERFEDLHRPRLVDGQRASALRFGDPRAQALFAALLAFRALPDGFANRDLRDTVAPLLGQSADDCHRGRATYDLRRLRLRGLIERIPRTRRYRVTDDGLRIAMRCHRTHARVLRPALSVVFDASAANARINRAIGVFDDQIAHLWEGQALAA